MRILSLLLLAATIACSDSDGGAETTSDEGGTGVSDPAAAGTTGSSGTGGTQVTAGIGGNGSTGSDAGAPDAGAVDAGGPTLEELMQQHCPGDPMSVPAGECLCDVPLGTEDGCTFEQCGLIVGCSQVYDCTAIWGPCSGSDVCVNNMCVTCTKPEGTCPENCRCDAGEGNCTSNDDCYADLICELNAGARFGLPADFGVCVSPICAMPNHQLFECGELTSRCGLCPPCPAGTPDCTDKSCGPDGCWGSCGEECGQGEAGCDSNIHCATDLVCGVDNGARFGFPADYRVCWPPVCEQFDQSSIPCGTVNDPCGLCL